MFYCPLSFSVGYFQKKSYWNSYFLLKKNRFGEIPLSIISQNSRNTDPLVSQKSNFFFFFLLSKDAVERFPELSFYVNGYTAAMWPAGGETMRQVDPNLLDASSAQDRNLSKSIPIFYLIFCGSLHCIQWHVFTKESGFRMKIATMIINLMLIFLDDSSSGMRWMWNSTFTLPSINGPGGIGAKLFSLFLMVPIIFFLNYIRRASRNNSTIL